MKIVLFVSILFFSQFSKSIENDVYMNKFDNYLVYVNKLYISDPKEGIIVDKDLLSEKLLTKLLLKAKVAKINVKIINKKDDSNNESLNNTYLVKK